MFGKFSEQLKTSTKPLNSLFAVNAKALESLSQHQTELFTGLMSDSVKYIESVSVQTEVNGVISANTEFAGAMRERFVSASKETYHTLNEAGTELGNVLKASVETATSEVKEAVAEVQEKAISETQKVVAAVVPATPVAEPKAEPVVETVAAPAPVVEEPVAEEKPVVQETAPATETTAPAAKKPTSRRRTSAAAKKAASPKPSASK